jgi:hypothetical protein
LKKTGHRKMKTGLYYFAFVITLPGILAAQSSFARNNFDFGAAGVIPVSGDRTNGYSAGPGWRGGYELRLIKHLGVEAGFTEGWPVTTSNCGRFGCTYSRESLKLLDYGVRGVAPVAGGRLELSIGLGGGYIWHPFGFSGPFGPNQALFQYSGKAAVALDRSRRIRCTFTVRTWRDLGRPTQQWLSTAAGLSYGFGRVQ